MSMISAQGEQAAHAALNALEGSLAKKIHALAGELIHAAAQMSAWVDYPDEEIEDITSENLKAVFLQVKIQLEELLDEL